MNTLSNNNAGLILHGAVPSRDIKSVCGLPSTGAVVVGTTGERSWFTKMPMTIGACAHSIC